VHLVGFIVRICHDARSHVTMHGHMNVKKVRSVVQARGSVQMTQD
jgi:hypothetical protein